MISPLVFKWNINGVNLEESFSASKYEPTEDDFDVSDYIVQSHTIENAYELYRYEQETTVKYKNARVYEYFDLLVELDDNFLYAIENLKLSYSSLAQYDDRYFDEIKQNISKFNSWKRENVESYKRQINEIFRLTEKRLPSTILGCVDKPLSSCIDDFERNNDIIGLKKWCERIQQGFQKQADWIVLQMNNIYTENLWSDYHKELKYDNPIPGVGAKLDKLTKSGNEILESLKGLLDFHNKYKKKKGCFALCVAGNYKYYTLSGVEDYEGSWNGHKKIVEGMHVCLKRISKALNFEQKGFKYAMLTDETMSYGRYINGVKQLNFWLPENLNTRIQGSLFDYHEFTCCERKILRFIPESEKKLKFFIRYEPCILCCPAMVSGKINRKISSIVVKNRSCSNAKHCLSEVVVLKDKAKDKYELITTVVIS